MLGRTRDQRLDLLLARDIAGDDGCLAAGRLDAVGDCLAGVGLARGDNHFGAELCEQLGGGAADAAAGAGDHGDLAGEIERGVFHCCWAPLIPLTWSLRAQRSNPGSFRRESLDCFVAMLLAMTAVAAKSTRHHPPRGAGGSRCRRTSSRSWSGA